MSRRFSIISSIICAIVVSTGASAQTNTWTDTFDGDAFDSRWGQDTPNPPAGSVSLDTNTHAATFESFSAINMWATRADAPILWAAAPAADFVFDTHVAMSTNLGGAVAGITVYDGDGGLPDFSFGLDHWNSGNRMVKFQGMGDNQPSVFSAATEGEVWLRLSLHRGSGVGGGDRYVAQYKFAEAAPWRVLYVYDAVIPNGRIGLVMKASAGGRTAVFSHAAMTELPARWHDSFDGAAFGERWIMDCPNPAAGDAWLDSFSHMARFESFAAIDMWTGRANAPIIWTPSPPVDYAFETHVAMPTTQHYAQAGITVYDGGVPDFVLCLDHWVDGSHQVRLQGLGDNVPNVVAPVDGGEAWLRLVVLRGGGDGGIDRYRCQYRTGAGNAWSTLTTYDVATPNQRVGLFVKAKAAGKHAEFSYAAGGSIAPVMAGDAIKVDFSTAGDADGGSLADWNQVGADGAGIPGGGVVRHGDGGVVGGVAITLTNYLAGRVNNDASASGWTGTSADPYYVLAADDIYYHGAADDLSVTFGGLDPALVYDVRVYALIGSNPGSTERFVVTDRGGTRSTEMTRGDRWSAATLADGGTVFTGVTVNASREVVVKVEDVSGVYYPLNAIVVEGVALSPVLPAVTNLGATRVLGASAALQGEVTGGAPPPVVTVHWWEVGGPTNRIELGAQWTVFETDLGGLSFGTDYAYYCTASNASGVAISPTRSFTTSATGTMPVVSAIPATNITTTTATVGGEVKDGDPPPEVSLLWGPIGRVTNVVNMGAPTGLFVTTLTGLLENTAYCYCCLATNVAGTCSSTTNSFITDASATIMYAGVVEGTEARFWRTSATNKTMDLDNDNVYGSSLGAVHWARGSVGQVDAGATTLGWTFLGAGAQYNLSGYALIDHVNTPGTETTAGIRLSTFTFALTGLADDYADRTVRIGIMNDLLATGEWAGDTYKGFRIVQLTGGGGDSGVVPLRSGGAGDGAVEMYFFDVTGVRPGDQFLIEALNNVDGTSGSSGYLGPVSWDIAETVLPATGTVLIVR